ncbi:MAG: non-canonical purine NTP pyrophosphatase [Pseudomonadales bacterium]
MKIVLATGNRGKLAELEALLAPLGIELVSQASLGITPAPEVRGTFVENALDKARHAARGAGLPALADDSGLVVPCLGGAPGIHSARYAALADPATPDAGRQANASDAANNARLLRELGDRLAGGARPAAYFFCSLVLVTHADDPAPLIASARWHGEICATARGSNGFGYDPHFYLPALGCTAAELDAASKGRLSHRGQATALLLRELRDLELP